MLSGLMSGGLGTGVGVGVGVGDGVGIGVGDREGGGVGVGIGGVGLGLVDRLFAFGLNEFGTSGMPARVDCPPVTTDSTRNSHSFAAIFRSGEAGRRKHSLGVMRCPFKQVSRLKLSGGVLATVVPIAGHRVTSTSGGLFRPSERSRSPAMESGKPRPALHRWCGYFRAQWRCTRRAPLSPPAPLPGRDSAPTRRL